MVNTTTCAFSCFRVGGAEGIRGGKSIDYKSEKPNHIGEPYFVMTHEIV